MEQDSLPGTSTDLLRVKEQDLAEWRRLPISGLLLRRLHEERDFALEHIANCVDDGKFDEAKITKGGLNLVRSLLAALYPQPQTMNEAQPEPDADPSPLPTRKNA